MNKKKRKTDKHYSKRIIKAMTALWFITAAFAMLVIIVQLLISPENVSLDGLYAFVGVPMSGGIISYLIKSAIENKEKIICNSSEEEIEKNIPTNIGFMESEDI